MFMGLWAYAFSENGERRDRIFFLLKIACGILIFSGFVALFSKWRLNQIPYHITHGWEGTALARYQHHAGTFFGGKPWMFHIYVPIGFLHSHLSYGALLMFVLPFLFLRAVHPVIVDPAKLFTREIILATLILAMTATVFVVNNARSALMGTVFSLAIAIYAFSRHYWKEKSVRVLAPIATGCVIILLLVAFAEHLHERLYSLVISLTGQEKHTDYQRVLLWNSVFRSIAEHPLLGVGAGHLQRTVETILLESSKNNPALWYANETLQRGHAHSDLLHFTAISGIPGMLSYLVYFAMLIYRTLARGIRESYDYWKFGPAGLLVAGLYQCYFQDDAVLLPFWLLVGLMLRITDESSASGGRKDSDLAQMRKGAENG